MLGSIATCSAFVTTMQKNSGMRSTNCPRLKYLLLNQVMHKILKDKIHSSVLALKCLMILDEEVDDVDILIRDYYMSHQITNISSDA